MNESLNRLPLWAVLIAALALFSCAKSPDNKQGGPGGETVAVFTKNQTNPYFQTVRLGAEDAVKQLNASVTQFIPTKPDDIPEQLNQIEDAIVRRPGAVVFIPVNSQAMVAGIEKLNAANIPVVNIVDRVLGGNVVSFMGCDETSLALNTGR